MKACLILIAFAAFLALPIRSEKAGSILFSAGLGLIFCADYGRRFRPLIVRQPSVAPAGRQDLRLAA